MCAMWKTGKCRTNQPFSYFIFSCRKLYKNNCARFLGCCSLGVKPRGETLFCFYTEIKEFCLSSILGRHWLLYTVFLVPSQPSSQQRSVGDISALKWPLFGDQNHPLPAGFEKVAQNQTILDIFLF